jgi:hypothetical protein
MIDIPVMELLDQVAIVLEALILWAAVGALAAKKTLIPAARRLDIFDGDEWLRAHHNSPVQWVADRLFDLTRPFKSAPGLTSGQIRKRRCTHAIRYPLATHPHTEVHMCRSIKTLANFEPPATDAEIHASALQFVRKLSGASKPSRANEAAFNLAVEQVTAAAHQLIVSLQSTAPPRNRDEEARKARERAAVRYA